MYVHPEDTKNMSHESITIPSPEDTLPPQHDPNNMQGAENTRDIPKLSPKGILRGLKAYRKKWQEALSSEPAPTTEGIINTKYNQHTSTHIDELPIKLSNAMLLQEIRKAKLEKQGYGSALMALARETHNPTRAYATGYEQTFRQGDLDNIDNARKNSRLYRKYERKAARLNRRLTQHNAKTARRQAR